MKKKLASLILLPIVLFSTIASCGKNNSSGSSSTPYFHEDNIPDDNYRNYYEIFVYSYCDSNGDKIGDLNGITSKLEYIRDLGYTGIWLTPIFTSSSLHKYNASSYYEIDASFGTLEDFDKLILKAHALGIKVILDLAINHSSKNASYFQKAVEAHKKKINFSSLNDEEKKYQDFYVFYDTEDQAKQSRKTYYKVPNCNFYYEANFDSDMPEFNFDNENVWQEFDNIMTFWQQKGVDGFRLDAVKYYYLNETNKNVTALSRIKQIALRNDPKAYIVGECWDSNSTIASYYQSEVDSYFYFGASQGNGFIRSSMGLDGADKGSYVRNLKTMIEYSKGHIPAPFLDNHDMSRLGVSDLAYCKFQYGLLSMLNGNTFTYYGDEIGMGGTVSNNDANARTHMDWSKSDEGETNNPYNGTGIYNFDPVEDQLKDPTSLINYYKRATNVRNQFPSIARGEIGTTYEASKRDRQVMIEKKYKDETIEIVFNFSKTNTTDYQTDKELVCYLQATDDIIKKDNTYTIPGYGIAIFK